MAAKPFGGFVFGKPKLEESSEKNNEEGEDKVNGSTDVKKNGEEKLESPNPADSMPKANGGGFNFSGTALENKAAEAKWTCDICMIKNASDVAKCVACENPKPGAVVSNENKSAKVAFFIGLTNSGTPAILHKFCFCFWVALW